MIGHASRNEQLQFITARATTWQPLNRARIHQGPALRMVAKSWPLIRLGHASRYRERTKRNPSGPSLAQNKVKSNEQSCLKSASATQVMRASASGNACGLAYHCWVHWLTILNCTDCVEFLQNIVSAVGLLLHVVCPSSTTSAFVQQVQIH